MPAITLSRDFRCTSASSTPPTPPRGAHKRAAGAQRRAIVLIDTAIALILLSGCATSPLPAPLAYPRGLTPVIPLSEDVRVGDVFIADGDAMPTLLITRLSTPGAPGATASAASVTDPPHPRTHLAPWRDLPRVSFGTLSISSSGRGTIAALLPVHLASRLHAPGLNVALARQRHTHIALAIRDARTHAVAADELLRQLDAWRRQPTAAAQLNALAQHGRDRDALRIRVVGRVYLARQLELEVQQARSLDAAAQAPAAATSTAATAGDAAGDAAVMRQRGTTLRLRERFDRPLVFACSFIDLQRRPDGSLQLRAPVRPVQRAW